MPKQILLLKFTCNKKAYSVRTSQSIQISLSRDMHCYSEHLTHKSNLCVSILKFLKMDVSFSFVLFVLYLLTLSLQLLKSETLKEG